MTDIVQQRMELMVPEIEMMKKTQLFSNKKIKILLKSRRNFEYKIVRPKKTPSCYLDYIRYEKSLYQLINCELKNNSENAKETLENIKIIQKKIIGRISDLYQRLCLANRHREDFWKQYLKFCKEVGKKDIMKKVFALMVQTHNRNENLWGMMCESQGENSYSTTRKIYHRAIGFCPLSELLWYNYFVLEKNYIEYISERSSLLTTSDGMEHEEEKESSSILQGDILLLIFQHILKRFTGKSQLICSLIIVLQQKSFNLNFPNVFQRLEDELKKNEELSKDPFVIDIFVRMKWIDDVKLKSKFREDTKTEDSLVMRLKEDDNKNQIKDFIGIGVHNSKYLIYRQLHRMDVYNEQIQDEKDRNLFNYLKLVYCYENFIYHIKFSQQLKLEETGDLYEFRKTSFLEEYSTNSSILDQFSYPINNAIKNCFEKYD
ncbi:hypothetical protein SNEBB_003119 [Seison nebaliae]|nr:hypothetical protein SNEBB_003119 [Seison nebaliae]